MGSGCRGLVVTMVGWVLAATLLASGAALLIYGIFAFGGPLDARTIAAFIVVPLGVFLLLLVGRGVWRDLRQDFSPGRPETEDSEEERSRDDEPT